MAFDYSSRDYATIKRDLLARADKVFPDWTDRDSSDFGMMMVDLWAYAADVMHYYIDRAAGESFLNTATQRESVLAIAHLLDYTPGTRSAAQGTVTLANSTSSAVTIPIYTQFVVLNNGAILSAYTTSAASLAANTNTSLTIREGTIILNERLTSSASGLAGQAYTLANKNVDLSSLIVSVYEDGVTETVYRAVDRLTSYLPGDRVYVTDTDADGSTLIDFGTNVNGFVPPVGALITATYATCSGAAGNAPANSVTGFKGSTPTGVTIASSSSMGGGVDDESIESLRTAIPTAVLSQGRAVTYNDFISLAQQVTDVYKAAISFSPSVGGSGAGNASVTVYAHGDVSDYLTTTATSYSVPSTMQSAVVSYLQARALLGVNVYAAPTVTWTPINISATVYVSDRYVSNFVKADVQTALDELFKFSNVFFGQKLTLGQVYHIIMGVPGVDYCTVTLFDSGTGTTLQNSITVNSLQLPKKGTVTLTMSGGITT